jgi:hypothetical protein
VALSAQQQQKRHRVVAESESEDDEEDSECATMVSMVGCSASTPHPLTPTTTHSLF